jgi:transposase
MNLRGIFVGFEAGGKAAAIASTLIETVKRDTVDPHTPRAAIMARFPDRKITKPDNLLPWHWNGKL